MRKILSVVAALSLFGALLITVKLDYDACRGNGHSHMTCSEGIYEYP